MHFALQTTDLYPLILTAKIHYIYIYILKKKKMQP